MWYEKGKGVSMNYWLMKSEPHVFSIDDLRKLGVDGWDGVRNYQARNYLRQMATGDCSIFYHSNARPPGASGLCRVVREAYPDATQWDKHSPYVDPKSPRDKPRWFQVDVAFVEIFPHFVPLDAIKKAQALQDMPLVKRGNRLSVMPLSPKHFRVIRDMGRKGP